MTGHELITALAKMTKEELDMPVLAPLGEAWDMSEVGWVGVGLVNFMDRGIVLWPGGKPLTFMTADQEREWRAKVDDE